MRADLARVKYNWNCLLLRLCVVIPGTTIPTPESLSSSCYYSKRMVSQREFSFSFRHTFFLVGSSNSIKKNFYLASYFLALHCILNFWEMSHFAYVICLKSFVEEVDKENAKVENVPVNFSEPFSVPDQFQRTYTTLGTATPTSLSTVPPPPSSLAGSSLPPSLPPYSRSVERASRISWLWLSRLRDRYEYPKR